jgi:hypothetical protein
MADSFISELIEFLIVTLLLMFLVVMRRIRTLGWHDRENVSSGKAFDVSAISSQIQDVRSDFATVAHFRLRPVSSRPDWWLRLGEW